MRWVGEWILAKVQNWEDFLLLFNKYEGGSWSYHSSLIEINLKLKWNREVMQVFFPFNFRLLARFGLLKSHETQRKKECYAYARISIANAKLLPAGFTYRRIYSFQGKEIMPWKVGNPEKKLASIFLSQRKPKCKHFFVYAGKASEMSDTCLHCIKLSIHNKLYIQQLYRVFKMRFSYFERL